MYLEGLRVKRRGLLCFILIGVAAFVLNGCSFGSLSGFFGASNPTVTPFPTATPTLESFLSSGDIIINEIYISKDGTGSWVELFNTLDSALSLDELNLNGVPLKGLTIPAKGYLQISSETADLSALIPNGKEACAITCGNTEIDRLAMPEAIVDGVSFGRKNDGKGFGYFLVLTPGRQNGGTVVDNAAELLDGLSVKINEIMSKNRFILIDEDGDAVDWVELKNCGETAVNLKDFGLSDNFSKPFKFMLPDVTVEPGGFVIICLSGKEKSYTSDSVYIHAPFKLSDSDDGLILTSNYGLTSDKAENIIFHDTLSFGRTPDDASKWKLISNPTPGRENGNIGFESIEEYENGERRTIIISEVCAVSSDNVDGLPTEDWIELRNCSAEPVNLNGYTLGKNTDEADMFVLPDVSIGAGAYLVVYAGEKASASAGYLNTGFKVGSSGSTIYLTDPEGYPVDVFETGVQRANITSGQRLEGNNTVREFYAEPTCGKPNADGKNGYAAGVYIDADSDELNAVSHTVTLSTLQPGGTIYYTLDGSVPTEDSLLYSEPFVLTESCVVRAVCIAENLIPSDISTRTFICDERTHTLNIVCVSSDPYGLYSEDAGIFVLGKNALPDYPYEGANFWQEWQRACAFEYYVGGELAVAFDAGMKVHGQYTRARESISFSINLKDAFGQQSVYYPFFGEDGVKEVSNFVLRTGGQDQNQIVFRDAFVERAVEGTMDLDVQDEMPVVLYINGQYQGVYFLREKINEKYIETHTGITEDNLDMIKGNTINETGDCNRMLEAQRYIRTHDMSTQEALDYISEIIDLEEWMNYWIVETYFGNGDSGNIRRYSARDGSTKWRWVLYDMDMSLESTYWDIDLIQRILNPEGHGYSNLFYTDLTYNLLVVNKISQEMFLERYAELMKTTLNPERLIPIFREYVEQVGEEMKYHCEIKYEINYGTWLNNVNKTIEVILPTRHELVKKQIQANFHLSDERMQELFGN